MRDKWEQSEEVGYWAEVAGNTTQQLEVAVNTMVWCGRGEHRGGVEVEEGSTVRQCDHCGWSERTTRRGINKAKGMIGIGVDVQEEGEATCGSRQSTYSSTLRRVG